MSGERVALLKERAEAFLELASEMERRGRLDLASFFAEQACQLRVKAALLRLTGSMPRVHGVRELIGALRVALEEQGFERESLALRDFVREHREALIDLESAYTEARYGYAFYTPSDVKDMISVTRRLFELLDEVERSVLG